MNPLDKYAFQSRAVLVLAGGISLLGGLWLMAWFWSGGLPYDTTSGVWTTLAHDAARGEFYRPVVSESGYGGTRYMPLFFSLHAALIALGISPASAGLLLTVASIGLLAAGVFRLMRRLGADATLAGACTCLLPASIAFQLLTISIKGDLLAVAFSVWGVVAALAWQREGSRKAGGLAAGLFAAAVLVKFTAVFGIGAVVLWLWKDRQRTREGVALTTGVLALALLGAACAYWASDGRMLESFAACATGGAGAGYALKFPYWFLRVAAQDPFFTAVFLGGALAGVRRFRRAGADLAVIYFALTLVGTLALFASPGIDSNHLIELLVASLVVVAVELTQIKPGRAVLWSAGLFAGMVIATWLPGLPSVRYFMQKSGRPTIAAVREIERRLPPGGTTRLLSENPFVPLILGQRPEMLDAFSLRLLAARSEAVRTRFSDDLAARRYTAIVLIDWSGAPVDQLPAEIERHGSAGVSQFYGEVHFPAGFLPALNANYRLSFAVPPFVVFEPKSFPTTKP